MTLTLERVARALGRARAVDEWTVCEKLETTHIRELAGGDLTAVSERQQFIVTVLSDRRSTRGEARFAIGKNDDGSLDALIQATAGRAARNVGPLWSLPRPAAPARVTIADEILQTAPDEAINDVAGRLASTPSGARVVQANITAAAVSERLRLSSGFEHAFDTTSLVVSGVLASGVDDARQTRRFSRACRRVSDLGLDLSEELETLEVSAGAEDVAPGVYDLIIAARALRPSADVDSWLRPLAVQASAELSRRGISRYQPGQAISGGSGDAVNIVSDGTIDFGLESAPIDRWGGPVRRFRVVHDGRAVALGLDSREAALRGVDSNGGARNLVLGTGARTFEQMSDGKRPHLVATAFDYLRANPTTGELTAQIALARAADGSARAGGHTSLDVFAILGSLRLSAADPKAPLAGPAWIGIPEVTVL